MTATTEATMGPATPETTTDAVGARATGTQPLLQVSGLRVQYGALTAVDDVHLAVGAGGRHALIGPNGAGKSSLFAALAGANPAATGQIFLDGVDISRYDEARRATAGLVRTYQHSNLFPALTVLDNVRIATEKAHGRPLRPWPSRRADRAITERAQASLAQVGLAGRADEVVSSLSHGERRQVEVALVLACRPRIVLFDEPTAGMSAAETQRFSDLVESLPSDVAVVIIEHDLDVVFRLADRISVLATGRIIAEGTPEEVRDDAAVQEAYLGTGRGEEPLFGELS
jgi:branched-chain amino acid transport system ATP-binding protein